MQLLITEMKVEQILSLWAVLCSICHIMRSRWCMHDNKVSLVKYRADGMTLVFMKSRHTSSSDIGQSRRMNISNDMSAREDPAYLHSSCILSLISHLSCFQLFNNFVNWQLFLSATAKMPNILWFQLLKCEDFLLFFVLYECKWISFHFGLLVR